MKRIACVLGALAMLFLFCSCKSNDTHKAKEYESIKTTATRDSVNDFITLLEKSGLISGYKIDKKNCYNVTPAEVTAETNMKIFKFSDSCASFVMVDNEIYPLCEFFGGYGFVNALPCDFDNDGNKDLLIASSCGSGMHCSSVSVFNSKTKESTYLYSSSERVDLIVARSTANIFTDNPEFGEKLYYSVLSVKINVENNNFAKLSYVVEGIEGHIEVNNGIPTFIPYQK